MATYPLKVQLAWNIVEQFIKDWKKDPYYYDNEFSIQAEIYTRIKKALELLGQQYVKADYKDSWVQKGYQDKQNWCRISTEPCIYLNEEKSEYCQPDLVLWDDNNDIINPSIKDKIKWPILWLCEIKVGAVMNSKTPNDNNWDLKKMEYLIQTNVAQFGCWLNFIYKLEPENAKNVEWEYEIKGKLWKINCYFPRISPTE